MLRDAISSAIASPHSTSPPIVLIKIKIPFILSSCSTFAKGSFIAKVAKELKTDSLTLIRGDVFRYLHSAPTQGFDFIFADPPYALKELPEVPELVFKRDLLRDGGIFVMEHPKTNDFSGLPYFYQHRVYGSVNFSIFIKEEEKTDA